MTRRLIGIGTAALAVTLVAGVAAAQRGEGEGDQGRARGPARALQAQADRGPGRFGPGRGMRPGAQDQQPGRGGPGRGVGRGQGPGPRLDLTDEQRTKVEALHRATRDQSVVLRDELLLTRRTLHRETFADARDDAKVAELAAKIGTLEKQLLDLQLKADTGIADLLTPAQRETMRIAGDRRGGRSGGPAGRGAARGGRGGPSR